MGRNKKETSEEKNENIEIHRIKMNRLMTGSYGVYYRDKVYNVPNDMPSSLAESFVKIKVADSI